MHSHFRISFWRVVNDWITPPMTVNKRLYLSALNFLDFFLNLCWVRVEYFVYSIRLILFILRTLLLYILPYSKYENISLLFHYNFSSRGFIIKIKEKLFQWFVSLSHLFLFIWFFYDFPIYKVNFSLYASIFFHC